MKTILPLSTAQVIGVQLDDDGCYVTAYSNMACQQIEISVEEIYDLIVDFNDPEDMVYQYRESDNLLVEVKKSINELSGLINQDLKDHLTSLLEFEILNFKKFMDLDYNMLRSYLVAISELKPWQLPKFQLDFLRGSRDPNWSCKAMQYSKALKEKLAKYNCTNAMSFRLN